MYRRTLSARAKRWPRRVVYTAVLLALLMVGAVFIVRQVYSENLKPVSVSSQNKIVVVPSGLSLSDISELLKEAGVIRQVWAFERYVKNAGFGDKLQAGTYKIAPSKSVQEIVDAMVQGKVAVDLITILPGQRIDQIRAAFIKAKFDPAAVDAALDPAQHSSSSPALADKPATASLEGFLYPDSYQKDANTDPRVIIRQSLAEMNMQLTPAVRAAFAAHGLSVYQGVTLASIVEQEVSKPDDRAQAAQVFLKRLSIDMPLGSDVTVLYGAIQAGQPPSLKYVSAYNTFVNKGLPAGPISNVTSSSIQAAANPAQTDWLYFVAGDDGKTYFSRTVEEHEALTKQYCHKLCN